MENCAGFLHRRGILAVCPVRLLIVLLAVLCMAGPVGGEDFSGDLRMEFRNSRSKQFQLNKLTSTDFIGNFRYVPYRDDKISAGLNFDTYYRNRPLGENESEQLLNIRPILGIQLSTLQYQLNLNYNQNINREQTRLVKQSRSYTTSLATLTLNQTFLPVTTSYQESRRDSGSGETSRLKSVSVASHFKTLLDLDGKCSFSENLLTRYEPELAYFSRQRATHVSIEGMRTPRPELKFRMNGRAGLTKNYDSTDSPRTYIEESLLELGAEVLPWRPVKLQENVKLMRRSDKTGFQPDFVKKNNDLRLNLDLSEYSSLQMNFSLEENDYGNGLSNRYDTRVTRFRKKLLPQADLTLMNVLSSNRSSFSQTQQGESRNLTALLNGMVDLRSNIFLKAARMESRDAWGDVSSTLSNLYSEFTRRLSRKETVRLTWLNNRFRRKIQGAGQFNEYTVGYSLIPNSSLSLNMGASQRSSTLQGTNDMALGISANLNFNRYAFGTLGVSRSLMEAPGIPETESLTVNTAFTLIFGKRTSAEMNWNFNQTRADITSRNQNYMIMLNYRLRFL